MEELDAWPEPACKTTIPNPDQAARPHPSSKFECQPRSHPDRSAPLEKKCVEHKTHNAALSVGRESINSSRHHLTLACNQHASAHAYESTCRDFLKPNEGSCELQFTNFGLKGSIAGVKRFTLQLGMSAPRGPCTAVCSPLLVVAENASIMAGSPTAAFWYGNELDISTDSPSMFGCLAMSNPVSSGSGLLVAKADSNTRTPARNDDCARAQACASMLPWTKRGQVFWMH